MVMITHFLAKVTLETPFLLTSLSQDHVAAFLCAALSAFHIAKDEYLFYR